MKTALITGGTAGIGKVTARELAKKGYRVIIGGRNPEKTKACVEELKKETGNANIDYLLADLSNLEEVRKMAADFKSKYPELHLLINNAGCVYQKRELTPEGYEKTFTTNHLSHFLLTHLLLDTIKNSAPARIINVSSGSHYSGKWDPANLQGEKKYSVMGAYANSKLANVLFTKALAEKLKNNNITVNCLHPGVVKTEIGNKNTNGFGGFFWKTFTVFLGISEDEGAKTSLYLALSPEVENITGKYFDKSKEKKSSEISNNFAAAEELWKISEQLVHLT